MKWLRTIGVASQFSSAERAANRILSQAIRNRTGATTRFEAMEDAVLDFQRGIKGRPTDDQIKTMQAMRATLVTAAPNQEFLGLMLFAEAGHVKTLGERTGDAQILENAIAIYSQAQSPLETLTDRVWAARAAIHAASCQLTLVDDHGHDPSLTRPHIDLLKRYRETYPDLPAKELVALDEYVGRCSVPLGKHEADADLLQYSVKILQRAAAAAEKLADDTWAAGLHGNIGWAASQWSTVTTSRTAIVNQCTIAITAHETALRLWQPLKSNANTRATPQIGWNWLRLGEAILRRDGNRASVPAFLSATRSINSDTRPSLWARAQLRAVIGDLLEDCEETDKHLSDAEAMERLRAVSTKMDYASFGEHWLSAINMFAILASKNTDAGNRISMSAELKRLLIEVERTAPADKRGTTISSLRRTIAKLRIVR